MSVVIVGRTNVGKSTLFNRLLGLKRAIVSNVSNVTRDRLSAYSELLGCVVTDTAGLGEVDAIFNMEFIEQTMAAILSASFILFIVDGKVGLLPEDRECLRKIRKYNIRNTPMLLLINKADSKACAHNIEEFRSLGIKQSLLISAEHAVGLPSLRDAVKNVLTDTTPNQTNNKRLSISIIGRPNAGKSSLINKVLGYKRMAVSDIAGTTREAISEDILFQGHRITLTDNAGTRRRYSRDREDMENLSMQSSIRAIEESDVVILIIDASTGRLDSQDLRLARAALDNNKPLIMAANKCDIVVDRKAVTTKLEHIACTLFRNCAVRLISAKTGYNCSQLLNDALKLASKTKTLIPASTLSKWLQQTMLDNPPKLSVSGKQTKLKHIIQCGSSPPKFRLYINTTLNNVGKNYERYLTNKLRKDFDLDGVPILLTVVTSHNPFNARK